MIVFISDYQDVANKYNWSSRGDDAQNLSPVASAGPEKCDDGLQGVDGDGGGPNPVDLISGHTQLYGGFP